MFNAAYIIVVLLLLSLVGEESISQLLLAIKQDIKNTFGSVSVGLGFLLLLYHFFAKLEYIQMQKWADKNGIIIVKITAIDIGDYIPEHGKWMNTEYLVKVTDSEGNKGTVVIWWLYQQFTTPYSKWVSESLLSSAGNEISNRLPKGK